MNDTIEAKRLLEGRNSLSTACEAEAGEESWHLPKQQRSTLVQHLHLAALYTTILFLGLLLSLYPTFQGCSPELIYSPAASAVSYELQDFEPAFFVANDYMGYPNERNNKLWEGLYSFGISGVTRTEATKLVNGTVPVKLADGSVSHLIELDVFHQLHCLNSLRQSLYEDEFPLWEYDKDGKRIYDSISVLHWDHCLDALRQTLMCHADITPISFHYNRTSRGTFPRLNGVHTCRNWDKIVNWAKSREAEGYEETTPVGEAAVGDIGLYVDAGH